MGIPGLANQIGNGERIALSKLAVDHFQRYGRKFRIAIDASIWLFQIKSGKGGKNPEIRTLYYRILLLLRLGIEPIFVFDGPARPSEKRNKKITGSWESPRAVQARAMLDEFAVVHHMAPGEAEAECAMLQSARIVDAVFSEDVDTLAFGAETLLRNWSSIGGSKARTHVSTLRAKDIREKTKLDRQGMILVALMSGGDYDTQGIEKCGALTAYEAAKAGFGHDLCELDPEDAVGLGEWRQRLQFELDRNESGFFKRKHPSIKIKDGFPNRDVLNNYMHPVVSSDGVLTELRSRLKEQRSPDIHGLRRFVGDKFGWDTLIGAKRLIHGLAPVMLTHRLLDKAPQGAGPAGLLSVCQHRTHHSSDGIPESRVEFVPLTLVPLTLEDEPVHRAGSEDLSAVVSDSGGSDLEKADTSTQSRRERSSSPTKKRAQALTSYAPSDPEKLYLAEFYVRRGAPEKIDAFEEALRAPKPASPKKMRAKTALEKTGMRAGAIESYFNVSKGPSSSARLPPVKRSKPVELNRAKTDVEIPEGSEPAQQLSIWSMTKDWNSNVSTWAEMQYYKSVETNRKSGKRSLQHEAQSADAQLPNGERDETSDDKPLGGFSSPIASQELLEVAPTPARKPFSSPISSQDLLDTAIKPTQSKREEQSATGRAAGNVRIRESLEGAWTTVSPQGQRAGTRLRGVESVDMS